MYLIQFILTIASALLLAMASPPSNTTLSPPVPTESPIIISEVANCINKTYVYCSHQDLVDNWRTDLPDAIRGVKHYCLLHQIDPYQYYRTMVGRTQVYICNYGDSLLPCTLDEYRAATDLLDDKCGEGKGAWMYRKTEDHTWAIGRDPTLSERDFRSECGMW